MGIKHRVNERFFEQWSPEMAYLLGYIYADGNILDCGYIRAKYLQIVSGDRSSLNRIRSILNSEHKITKHDPIYIGGKNIFRLKIGSHKIYNDLCKFGLHPSKSLDMIFPDIPKIFISHFLRGYFDGDGCVYLEKSKSRLGRIIIKRLRVIFTSGSKIFLEKMLVQLSRLISNKGKIYDSKRAFQLVFNGEDSVKFFKLIYSQAGKNTFFMRKFLKFNEYFKMRPSKTDAQVLKILNFHNKKATW